MSQGARGGGATNHPDIRWGEAARHHVSPHALPTPRHADGVGVRPHGCRFAPVRRLVPHWWSVGVELHAPTPFYPWSPRSSDAPAAPCAGPLGRADPSSGRSPYGGPGTITSGSHQWVHARRGRGESLRLQRGPLGDDPVLDRPPEGDGEFPRQGHNADPLTAPTRRTKAALKPVG